MFAEILIILMSIFMITTASIGVECYNKAKLDSNDTRKNTKNFLIVMIVFGILGVFGGGAMMYAKGKAQGASNAIRAVANNKIR